MGGGTQWTPGRLVGVIAYGVLGFCIVILFFSDARQDAFDARRAIDIANARAETVHCIQQVIAASNDSTTARSDASAQRDEAELAKERAMSVLVDGRVQDGLMTSQAIQQAARQWQAQFDRYERETLELQKARRDNPVPDIEKVCK